MLLRGIWVEYIKRFDLEGVRADIVARTLGMPRSRHLESCGGAVRPRVPRNFPSIRRGISLGIYGDENVSIKVE
jgi:hypothetical protein